MAYVAGPTIDWSGGKAPQAQGVSTSGLRSPVVTPITAVAHPAPDLAFDNPAPPVINPVGYAV